MRRWLAWPKTSMRAAASRPGLWSAVDAARLVQRARDGGAACVVLVATASVRDAANADDLVAAEREWTGIELQLPMTVLSSRHTWSAWPQTPIHIRRDSELCSASSSITDALGRIGSGSFERLAGSIGVPYLLTSH